MYLLVYDSIYRMTIHLKKCSISKPKYSDAVLMKRENYIPILPCNGISDYTWDAVVIWNVIFLSLLLAGNLNQWFNLRSFCFILVKVFVMFHVPARIYQHYHNKYTDREFSLTYFLFCYVYSFVSEELKKFKIKSGSLFYY